MIVIGFILSLIMGFLPMFCLSGVIYWLDRYEKEPKLLLGGVFIWGAVVAVIGALILQLALGQEVQALTGSKAAVELTSSSIFAPVTEEILKGMAVFLVFLFFRREFDSVLDGIVYASITALGFAATEDVLYYFGAYVDRGFGALTLLFFLRFVIFGWQHAFFTSFTGIGLAIARLNRDSLVRFVAPLAGLGVAIFAHSLHNSLLTFLNGMAGLVVGAIVAWSGWLLMFAFILFLIFRERRWMSDLLREEVGLGVISPAQYRTACSLFGQSGARFSALWQGRYGKTARFFQLCGELSLKKHQYVTLGDESGNWRIIEKLRAELARLSPQI